jgi:competence protein ComFC
MPGNQPTIRISKTEAQATAGLLASHRLAKRLWTLCLELVFPARCAGCGRVDTYWCDKCQQSLDTMPFAPRQDALAPLSQIAATAVHVGKIQSAIHSLKYENGHMMARPLGQRMSRLLRRLNWTIDILVPVPLHTSRLRERGYNQAQLLSEIIASEVGIPCITQALSREQFTRSQVGLNAVERQANLEDAFQANPTFVADKTILLIDDVYTTGATLSVCAAAALSAGAREVYGLTATTAHGRKNYSV